MRKFPAHQLAQTENELMSLAFNADQIGWDIGEHSDRMHWDDAGMVDASDWIREVEQLRNKLDRAEGLLRAYELFRKATIGEVNDDARVG